MTFVSLRMIRCFSFVCVAGLLAGMASAQDEKPAKKFQVPASLYDAPVTPPAPQPAVQPKPDTVLARVGDANITVADLIREMQGMAQMLSRQMSPQQLEGKREEIRNNSMNSLINRKLLEAEAVNQKISVTSASIDEAIANIEKSLPPGSKLDEQLSAQGGNRADLRKEIESQLKLTQLLQKNNPAPAPVTEEEIALFYKENPAQFQAPETVHVRHVLIQTAKTDSEAVKQEKKSTAETLQRALSKGGDFEEIAKTRSDCPSKVRGGDLGLVARGQTVPEFESAAFSQAIGVVGPVVETPFGYHILRVEARNPARTVPLDEAKSKIGEFLLGQKQQKIVSEYVMKLRSTAKIEFPTQPK